MPAFKDLSGQKFGRLTVLERGPNQGSRIRWLTKCDCGIEKMVQGNHMTSGRQVSCGCHRQELASRPGRNLKHGYNTPAIMAEYGTQLRHLWNDFHLSFEAFTQMTKDQKGLCAICQLPPLNNKWAVDHDHACCPTHVQTCGKCVRALLCHNCNKALGFFGDDPELMEAGARYIREHQR